MTPWPPPQPWPRPYLTDWALDPMYDPCGRNGQTWRQIPALALTILAEEAAR